MDLSKFNGTNYNPECESTLAEADNLIKAGQIQAGFELLLKMVQYNPTFGKAYNYLGWIYETQFQNYNYAEECYKQAIKYASDYIPAYLNYAYLLSSNGHFDELKAHLDIALTIPNIPKDKIYNHYAFMSEMQQNLEVAMNYYINAAINTLDTNTVTYCKEAINRCQMKLELKKVAYPV